MRRIDVLLESQITSFLSFDLFSKLGVLWSLASRLLQLSGIKVVDALICCILLPLSDRH